MERNPEEMEMEIVKDTMKALKGMALRKDR
jgi:hypothetical protein